MQQSTLLLILIFSTYGKGTLFPNLYRNIVKPLGVPIGADVGEPLILTPFLKNGSILEGQQAALVQNSHFLNTTSYAGYFTVDDRFNSSLWFWFFPSAGDVTEDPVVLWLDGGPGASSMYGLFDEIGPFEVHDDWSISLKEYTWHNNHSLIYVDNPVGVGFSFTNGGYAKNETKVGDDMYSALTQFFQLFPDFQTNPFYISGSSYAGKYLPAVGHAIFKNGPQAEIKINLQGLLIGDGWTDPINQLNFGPYLYNLGLVSEIQKEQFDQARDKAIELIKAGDWPGAVDVWHHIQYIFMEITRISMYNYIADYNYMTYWEGFLNSEEIRKALHVGNTVFGDDTATDALADDEFQSVAPWVEELLEHFRILMYTGQLDITCGYPMVVDYLQALNFTGVGDYHNSSRDVWFANKVETAGYVRSGGNLVELLVRNAGHLVTRDQPKWSYEMLYKFTRNIPLA